MIALGTSLPEFITRGDASNANYSSSMVAESPFIKAMESWQDFFEKPLSKVFERVVEYGIATGKIPPKTTKFKREYDRETGKDIETEEEGPTDTTCEVNMAMLLHRDLEKETNAYINQDTNGIISEQTAREKLGHDNETELDRLDKERRDAEEREPDISPFQLAAAGGQIPPQPGQPKAKQEPPANKGA
jgi:hypothetical protein